MARTNSSRATQSFISEHLNTFRIQRGKKKAVTLTHYFPVDDHRPFLDVEVDIPTPDGHDILVNVQAIAVNPVDTKVRAPKDTVDETPRVIGYDAPGIVASVGPDVTLIKVGDEVYYASNITRSGTNAKFHLVDERIVGHKPTSLSYAEAAAPPLLPGKLTK